MNGPDSEMLTSALLEAVPHGFSTGAGLDPQAVLPGAALIHLRQVHSASVVEAEGPWSGDPPVADAVVTNRTGLLLAIVTADCAPVLLCDREAAVVGAAHAGWRGALAGVIGNTVAAMVALGARSDRMTAVIGPTIARQSYEVGEDLHAAFLRQSTDNAGFFTSASPGHFQFDLPAYVAARLAEAGVGAIADLREDTYSQSGRFHSFRRATHRQEPTAGRQTSVIGIAA